MSKDTPFGRSDSRPTCSGSRCYVKFLGSRGPVYFSGPPGPHEAADAAAVVAAGALAAGAVAAGAGCGPRLW